MMVIDSKYIHLLLLVQSVNNDYNGQDQSIAFSEPAPAIHPDTEKLCYCVN